MSSRAGLVFHNRYRVVKLLAQGGFGTLYRAWDISLERPCVLKENQSISQEAQRQFLREAKILASLNHPNLPRVTDFFLDPAGSQYLVMDYVEGQDLQQMIEERGAAFPEDRVIEWGMQICDALIYLHHQTPPVIHRDIKPANIQITPQNRAVLIDFGIAKTHDPMVKTTLGAQAVTPGYSPIEQYGKGRTDARSDIYSLGATLYTLLTGQEPIESAQRAVNDTLLAPRLINNNLSLRTSSAVMRALQINPTQRFSNMMEFKAALTPPPPTPVVFQPTNSSQNTSQQVFTGSRDVAPPTGWLALVIGLLLIITALLFRLSQIASGSSLQVEAARSGSQTWVSTLQNTPYRSGMGEIGPTMTLTTTTFTPTLTPLVYIVQAGDTCSEIAEIYQVSIREIVQANEGLSAGCDLLYSGQVLLIPQSNGPRATRQIDKSTIELKPQITQVSDIDGMTQVYIPAGRFIMGADLTLLDSGKWEKPAHTIYLSAFWLDQTEVTNEMYQKCEKAGVCPAPSNISSRTRESYYGNMEYDNYPVIYVSWDDAHTYCRWAGRRLPSEAEWEKAARGTDGRQFPWGEKNATFKLANFGSFLGDTTKVGVYPDGASFYGIWDMAGNVAEWVADWFEQNYYSNSPYQDPPGPRDGEFRLIRGGSWFSPMNTLRTTFRMWNYPGLRADTIGFRCAR